MEVCMFNQIKYTVVYRARVENKVSFHKNDWKQSKEQTAGRVEKYQQDNDITWTYNSKTAALSVFIKQSKKASNTYPVFSFTLSQIPDYNLNLVLC